MLLMPSCLCFLAILSEHFFSFHSHQYFAGVMKHRTSLSIAPDLVPILGLRLVVRVRRLVDRVRVSVSVGFSNLIGHIFVASVTSVVGVVFCDAHGLTLLVR